ncbi:MAG: hypothetical protein JSR33_01785 [Proteobacteria bacterium]|nr:hypothetical protein [Pseudomonadota bacterium]
MKNIALKKITASFLATNRQYDEYHLAVLDGNDVISTEISDHHPVILNNTLYFNIMMKCAQRRESYNNGFGKIETDLQYRLRLSKLAAIISEIVVRNPTIYQIGICEGPIREVDLNHFLKSFKAFPWMKPLITNGFYHPEIENKPNWGLLLLANSQFAVKKVANEAADAELLDRLANRLQTWELTRGNHKQFFSLWHLPFSNDEIKTSKTQLSAIGHSYCQLIAILLSKYYKYFAIACGDFNFNPFFVEYYSCNKIPSNNSVQWENGYHRNTTVDGIILSNQAKKMSFRPMIEIGLYHQPGVYKPTSKNYKKRRQQLLTLR